MVCQEILLRVDGLHYLVARKVAGEGAVAGQQGPSGSAVVTDSCLSEEQQPPAHHGGQAGEKAGQKGGEGV